MSKRIFGLDLIRFIAISLVMISHCTILIAPKNEGVVVTFIKTLGAVGVDLFFVLSGFLIGGILLKYSIKNFDFSIIKLFFKRRWLRTLPNYFLVLIINIVLIHYFNNEVPNDLWKFFFFVQNLYTPQSTFFLESWSLSIEEFSYLIAPLALYLILRAYKNKSKEYLFFMTTLLLILVFLVVKIMYYYHTEIDSSMEWSRGFRKVVIYRIDSIYLGFLLVYLYTSFKSFFIKYARLLFLLGLFIFGLTHVLILLFKLTPVNHLWFFTFVYLQLIALSLALLFPLCISIQFKGWVREIITYISKLSYAIYLVNYSIVLVTLHYFFYDVNRLYGKLAVAIAFLILTIVLSAIIYKYFELPILKIRDKKYKSGI